MPLICMYRILYNIPLWFLCIGLILFYTGWIHLRHIKGNTLLWRVVNILAVLMWITITLYITLFARETGNGGVILEPFWSYKIALFEGNYDYFQEIYLNILAFAYLGMIVPTRSKNHYIVLILLTMVFSVGIEYFQYYLDVGLAEVDDVFSNTLGVILGALVNSFSEKYISIIIQVRRRWKKN